ncbi:DUF4268 domain-containing protein [Lentzea sp. NPDC059081]|uniref:DUF4268 domain-containing protein n=1 Tax=Lentzea sp. NPDC059081 TaxID=3346719 RepID=UPI0036C97BE4
MSDLSSLNGDSLLVASHDAEVAVAETPLVSLSRVQSVPITSVWPTEPHHFTPWLLANADLLSEVLGLDVELVSREYKVGKFSLDIIGHEVETGTPVIVENQYGQTDHGHLGQILTYAGGTKPTTIVWIAERFREEHRAALDWLNTHTEPGIRFFGVRLAAVTLTGAPAGLIAPWLELVVKPNDWEKHAMAAATAGTGPSQTQQLYQQFWSLFEPRAKERGWTNASAPAQNWWSMPTGVSHAIWSVSYATFGCRSELYFEHPDPDVNLVRWQTLDDRKQEILDEFGDDLIFDELPGNKGCRIETRLHGPKIGEQQRWHEVLAWMLDSQTRLRRAVSVVGGVPTTTAAPTSGFAEDATQEAPSAATDG